MVTSREFLEIGIVATGATLVGDQLKRMAADTNLLATAEQRQAVAAAESAKAITGIARAQASSALIIAKDAGGGGAGSAELLASTAATKADKLATNDLAVTKIALSSKIKELAATEEAGAKSTGVLGTAMKSLGISAGAGVAIAGIAGIGAVITTGVTKFVELGSAVRGVQGVMGGSSEQASLLVGQMKALGIDVDTGTKALGFLGAQLGGNASKLHAMGVETKYLANGNVDVYGTLQNVEAAIAGTTDASEKDAIAKVALGRGYLSLNALLKQTPEYLAQIDAETKKSGNIFSGQDTQNAKDLKVALNQMKESVDGLEISLVKGLGPTITGILHVFTDLTSGLRTSKTEQALFAGVITGVVVPALLKLTVTAAGPLIGALGEVGGALLGMGGKALAAGQSMLGMGAETSAAAVTVVSADDAMLASMTALGATAETTAVEVEAAGLTMATAAGPIGLAVAVVVGLGTAFHNTGQSAKDFVAQINKGFSGSSEAGLQGQIDADTKALKVAQQKLADEKSSFKGIALGPKFDKAEQVDQSQIKVLKQAIADNTQAMANARKVAADLGLTVDQVFANAASNSIPLTGAIGSIEDKFKAAGFAADTLGSKGTAAYKAMLAAQKETDAEADKLSSALTTSVDAEQALATATKAEADAVTAHNTALAEQTKLVAGGIAADKDYISAIKGVESAAKSYASAVAAETDAQTALAKAQQPATALQLADANNKLALSFDSIATSQADVADKQQALDELLVSGTATVNEIAKARAQLAESKDKVTQNQINVEQAKSNIDTLNQKGTAADPAVIAAQKALANAHDNVANALQGEKDAQDKVNAAQVAYAQKVVDAQAKVDSTAADIVTKQGDVYKATISADTAAGNLRDTIAATSGDAYNEVKAKVDALVPSYGTALSLAQQLAAVSGLDVPGPGIPYQSDSPTATGQIQKRSGARASGGPVEPQGLYLVGEKGPELLHVGAQAGQITPNSGLGGAGTVTNHNVTVNAHSGASALEIAQEAAWALLNIVPAKRTAA